MEKTWGNRTRKSTDRKSLPKSGDLGVGGGAQHFGAGSVTLGRFTGQIGFEKRLLKFTSTPLVLQSPMLSLAEADGQTQ
jgi:hypothetical protein